MLIDMEKLLKLLIVFHFDNCVLYGEKCANDINSKLSEIIGKCLIPDKGDTK